MFRSVKIFVFVNFLVLLAACNSTEPEQAKGEFQVEPYLQFATKTSMVIMWETMEEATTIVEYGESQFNSESPNISETKTIDGYRTMHEVVLENLKTETNYFYRVKSVTESGKEVISEIYPFKTAVNDDSAYMFALVGDSQKNSRTPEAWERIAQLVWDDRPNFVVHVGDIVDDGNRLTDWTEHFFPGGHILMSKTAMYTALGNHENDSDYYYQYMHNPPPEYYYTFKYGNAQFFIVDTNRDVTEGSEQFTWLEWELAKSEATWKIVLHHHPPYSSEENDHGDGWKESSSMGTHARNLVPLFEEYGVDFDLFGHTHVYERTWPLKDDLVNMQEGVVYINSGGAGGGLEDFLPMRTWFSAELQTGHHYCTFSIFDRTLVFKAIDWEGRMFDTFQMQKPEGSTKAQVIQPPAPKIFPMGGGIFENSQEVTMEAVFENLTIRYTTDGSEPNSRSTQYTGPFEVDETATIRARAFNPDGKASRINRIELRKVEPLDPVTVTSTEEGLTYNYYEQELSDDRMPDFSTMEPKKSGVSTNVDIDLRDREEYILFEFEGYIEIEEAGRYTFYTNSDDGSMLYIHGQNIVNNDGSHGMKERSGDVILNAGLHPFKVEFFQGGGGKGLEVSFNKLGEEQKPIPSSILKH